MLFAVGAGAETQGRTDARRTHGVDHFVAAFDGGEHLVPLAFDVGAVGVQLGFEAGFGEHALVGGDFFGYGSPDADGDHTEICNDLHGHRLLADKHSLARMAGRGHRQGWPLMSADKR